jgi:hypothetical protein
METKMRYPTLKKSQVIVVGDDAIEYALENGTALYHDDSPTTRKEVTAKQAKDANDLANIWTIGEAWRFL